MPRKRIAPQQSKVLEAKLEAVNSFVTTYEGHIEAIRARMQTEEDLQVRGGDAHRLLEVLRDTMVPASQAAVATSLIDDDLKGIMRELGPPRSTRVSELRMSALQGLRACAALQHLPPQDGRLVAAVLNTATAITDFLRSGLEPGLILRNRIISDLNRSTTQKSETIAQRHRRRRDEVILELADKHRTRSTARLLNLVKGSNELSALADQGIKITPDVIRNVLKADPKRGM